MTDKMIYEINHIELKWCCDPRSCECNFSICIGKPEKFRASTGFVKNEFITARIIASPDRPLIIIKLNNNEAPLQKSLIVCFPWLDITWYLEQFPLFLPSFFIVCYFFFLISVHGKNIWNNLYKIILNCFWEEA